MQQSSPQLRPDTMQGAQVTECVIFICLMGLWLLYMLLYFADRLAWLVPLPGRKRMVVALWGTALRTRETWARDLMSKAEDAQGAALLAVQQMRNIIVASTLLVMGISQVMGRLIMVMTSESNLSTIAALARQDPMTGPSDSWAPAYVRVAVPFGATLLALLCFGQAVRLAVHVGFNIRVQGVTGGKGLELPHGDDMLFSEETVGMLQRLELYFTLGLRSLYLFIGTIFWTLGTTPLLVSSLATLILLFLSDALVVRRGNGGSRAGRRKAGSNLGATSSDGYAPAPAAAV